MGGKYLIGRKGNFGFVGKLFEFVMVLLLKEVVLFVSEVEISIIDVDLGGCVDGS